MGDEVECMRWLIRLGFCGVWQELIGGEPGHAQGPTPTPPSAPNGSRTKKPFALPSSA